MPLFSKKPIISFGLYLNGQQLNIVAIQKRLSTTHCVDHFAALIPAADRRDACLAAIKKFQTQHPVARTQKIYMALPGIHVLKMTTPNVSCEQNVTSATSPSPPFQKHFPKLSEPLTIASCISTQQKCIDWFAISQKQLDFYQNICTASGLTPTSLEPDYCSLLKTLQRFNTAQHVFPWEKTMMLMACFPTKTLLIIFQPNRIIHIAHIPNDLKHHRICTIKQTYLHYQSTGNDTPETIIILCAKKISHLLKEKFIHVFKNIFPIELSSSALAKQNTYLVHFYTLYDYYSLPKKTNALIALGASLDQPAC